MIIKKCEKGHDINNYLDVPTAKNFLKVKLTMNILVTGGSGFLGSHVINQLLKNGYRVINYDLKNNLYINKK